LYREVGHREKGGRGPWRLPPPFAPGVQTL
jgi:hypothetical protein